MFMFRLTAAKCFYPEAVADTDMKDMDKVIEAKRILQEPWMRDEGKAGVVSKIVIGPKT